MVRRAPLRQFLTILSIFGMVGALLVAAAPGSRAQAADDAVLVFSATAGFRHDTIPDGIAMVEQLGADNGFSVTATEDAAVFNDDDLADYDAVVWLSTTGDVLDDDQQAAFERYIQAGGGYAGIHAASDTEYEWSWYGDLVGAYFDSHPAIQEATVTVQDRVHPSTAHLPLQWTRTDEWYNFSTNPTGQVHVLAELDESSYDPGAAAMGPDHAISWCHEFDGGRAWYTGMGHTADSFTDPAFQQHVLGGILTAANLQDADCGATVASNYEAVKLTSDIGEPMTMDIAPDGRVFYTSRRGALQVYDPATAQVTDAANLEVFSGLEDGLIGLAFDPDFEDNQWIYIHYSVPPADTDTRRISRFTMDGNTLDLDSEIPMLEWFTQRDVCCHTAGDMAWDSQGNLYVSTGDNTNSMASDGMTPIDEREGRSAYDAQRTSGNTNDLSGKIMRIHPEDDGTYTIPDGNLQDLPWAQDQDPDLIRDEIYVMGLRNPFRIWVDPETDWLYWGNVGPDATNAIPGRGPRAFDEWDVAKEAGNYGWPYCSGPNVPYNDYDFATGQSGDLYDCEDGPTNDSPNNTGTTLLPPAIGSDVWYGRGNPPPQFPWIESGSGNTAMGGVIYDHDDAVDNETKFPPYWDGKWFVYEWSREFFKVLTLDPETEQPVHVDDFAQADPLVRGMDMEFGPDGHLYILDYGTGYFSGSPEAGLWRIDYTGGRQSPTPDIVATPTSGQAPLEVTFDGTGSSDPNGDPLEYAWDFDDDGTVDATEPEPIHTYTVDGEYDARLTVVDPNGNTGTITTAIVVGNTVPEVTIEVPVEGGYFAWGEDIPFTVAVTDAEDGSTADGTIDCDRIAVSFVTGHETHGHPQSTVNGCEGVLETGDPGDGHGLDANVFGLVAATYADDPQGDVGSITTDEIIQLEPKHRQAEHFDETGSLTGDGGVAVIGAGAAEGGARIGDIQHGEWVRFSPVNLAGIDTMDFLVSSGGAGGDLEVRIDAPDGPLVASVPVADTGGYDSYEVVSTSITDPGGTHDLYLVFTNPSASGSLFDVDAIFAIGKGVAADALPRVDSVTATPSVGAAPLEVAFEAVASDPEGTTLTYAWDFGDGATGEGATPTHTYEQGGSFDVDVTVTDEAGLVATGGTTVEVYAPADACLRTEDAFCVLDVSAYTNNDGIASAENPADGNFDGGGYSYPAEEMPEAGAVTLVDVPWEFPTLDDAQDQNVEARGQTIGLYPGTYGQLHLLAAAHNGSVDTTATVTYVDGTTSQVPIRFTDWAQSPSFGEDVAVAAGYRYNTSGEATPPVNIFHQAVPLDAGREPALLTLPDQDRFHLFAVTQDASTLAPSLVLSPSSGEPSFGDDYTVVADLATGGVPNAGQDVRFEVYRADESATPPDGLDGTVHAPVTDATSTTGDDGSTSMTYSHDAAADDVVVACTGVDDCVDGDVLVVDGDTPVNLADEATAVDTATVTWIEGLELEEGYEWLFDGGQETFNQWQQAGPGSFTLQNEVMTSQGGLGLFWYPEQSYENFTLRLQWRAAEATDNSGVFVRFPDPGDDPGVAIDNGHEIQIYDADTGEPQKTGSIYNADPADEFNSNPPGSWNDYEIEVVGRDYTVTLNGQVINTYTDTQGRGLEGFIGLQNHGDADVVSFRNVRITELPPGGDTGPVLDSIGITDDDNTANGQIPGTTSFAAELLPDAGSLAPAPDDEYDDVELLMPADTSGTVPNMAGTNGQRLELTSGEQGVVDTLHFFGAGTDAGQGTVSGDFTLEFADGSTQVVTVTHGEWGYPGPQTDTNHIAIGPMDYRHDANGDQYAPVPFHMFHAAVTADSASPLVAITFPTDVTATDPGGTPEELYTLGITLEDGDGATVPVDLAENPVEPTSPLDAVGITDDDNTANGQIPGTTSFAAELLPDAGSVAPAPDDADDDVPMRMPPDTSGTVPNMATTSGQRYDLPEGEQGVYDTLHVFGAGTDADQGTVSGDFTLEFADGSTQVVTVTHADWGYPGTQTETNHVAVGPMDYRHDANGDQYAPVPFHLYHAAVSTDADSPLVAVTFPTDVTATQPGGTAEELYTLALTFEAPDGTAVAADLAGAGEEPDTTPPTVEVRPTGVMSGTFEGLVSNYDADGTATLTRDGDTTSLEVTFTGLEPDTYYPSHVHADACAEDGLHYADDPAGDPLPPNEIWPSSDPSDPQAGLVTDQNGNVTGTAEVPYTARIEALSVVLHGESFAKIACADLSAQGSLDIVVTASDDQSGVASVEYLLDDGDWTPYESPVTVGEPGEHTLQWRATDQAGNVSDVGEETFVVAEGGDDEGSQTITVTVPEGVGGGEFLWTIDGDGMVALGEMQNQGGYLQALGAIDPIMVTDTRSDGPSWSIAGQVSDFGPDGPVGNHLGWTPSIIEDGAGAVAGPPVPSGIDGGDGLSVASTLASADTGHEAGTATLGADLDLRFPAATDPGDYTATLTVTALS